MITGKERAALIFGNAVPAIGVLFLGWDAAPAIFLLWLDTLFGNVGLVATVRASAHLAVQTEFSGPHAAAQRRGAAIGLAIGMLAFLSPALGVGVALYELLRDATGSSPLAAVFSAPAIAIVIAVQVALGVVRLAARHGRKTFGSFAELQAFATAGFANVCNRCMVLLALAWLSRLLGHYGVVAFLVSASIFVTWVDLHEDWLGELQRRLEAAGRARRERDKMRR